MPRKMTREEFRRIQIELSRYRDNPVLQKESHVRDKFWYLANVEHLTEERGMCVAIHGERVILVADDFEELRQRLEKNGVTSYNELLIERVPEHLENALIYHIP